MQAAPGKKKPYRPPRPDANTFSTQHEFLESLTPVPADSVGEKDRKCAHCWKRFGEADPGLDNAEEPVRFRCGHVFGERCMKELFCPPEAVRIDMLPLSFAPGSRGAELGRRLSAYVDQCGVDKGALLIGGKREKDFTRLLNEVQNANRGYEILGKEWYPRVHQAMHPNLNLHDVHLLENAVIFDVGIPEPKGKPTFIPEYTTAAVGYIPSMPTEWTATSTEDLLALADEAQHLYEAAKNATPDSSNASSTPVSSINNNGLPSFASLLGALHGDVDVPDHDPSFATTTSEPVSQPDTPGSAKTVAEITSELLAEDQALIEMMSTLEDPALAMDSPAYVAYQQMMEHYSETATEGSIPSSEDGPEPMEGVEQPSTDTAAEPLQGKLPSIHEALSSAETGGTAPGAWKDKLPKVSKLDKLVSLQKSQADAKQAFKAAKKSEASIKASKEASQRRAAKAKAERDARKQELIAVLARSLARVYDEYEQHQFDSALAAGQPPPIKRLKLASPTSTITPPPVTDAPIPGPLPMNVIHLSAMMHRHDVDARHYEVPQPYTHGGDPEDEDDDETINDEAQGLSEKTIFLTRTTCRKCFKHTAGGPTRFFSLPEYICWKNTKSVPDGCPICHKVLFRKGLDSLDPHGAAMAVDPY